MDTALYTLALDGLCAIVKPFGIRPDLPGLSCDRTPAEHPRPSLAVTAFGASLAAWANAQGSG